MTTEILTLANSIAESKESIRQAIVARGTSCDASVPLADYADKINNMVVSGTVDNILATNYTGAAVTAGDKVFFKANAAVEGERAQVYSTQASQSSYYYIVNPAGTKVFYNTYIYDVSSGTTESSSYSGSWASNNYPLHYDSNGNLFAGKYILGESAIELAFACNQDDYAMPFTTSSLSSGFVFRKIDKTDFSVTQSWTVSMGSSVSSPVSCVIGDKLYVSSSTNSSGNRYIGTIDENSATISMDARSDEYVVAYSTADNALAICAKGSTPMTSCKWYEIALVSVDNNNELDNVFVSSNSDLTTLQGLSNNFVVFNRNTGILCIGNNSSNDYYGVFKYNTTTKDFDTVALVLPDYSSNTEYKIMTATTDLSKLQLNNYIYTLAQPSGGYKALAYQPNIGSDILTGVALDGAATGATFNVKTILP